MWPKRNSKSFLWPRNKPLLFRQQVNELIVKPLRAQNFFYPLMSLNDWIVTLLCDIWALLLPQSPTRQSEQKSLIKVRIEFVKFPFCWFCEIWCGNLICNMWLLIYCDFLCWHVFLARIFCFQRLSLMWINHPSCEGFMRKSTQTS